MKKTTWLGHAALAVTGIAVLAAAPSLGFDNMTPEQRAVLEAQAAETAAPTAGNASAGERTIFDGVYTADQAERGHEMFSSDCAACHGNQARGGPGSPGLVGYTLDNKYADQPLFAYWDFMRTNMPPGNAGWFTDQEYADITAYLLELHGAPAGETELEGTEEAMQSIMVVPTPE